MGEGFFGVGREVILGQIQLKGTAMHPLSFDGLTEVEQVVQQVVERGQFFQSLGVYPQAAEHLGIIPLEDGLGLLVGDVVIDIDYRGPNFVFHHVTGVV